MIIVNNELYYTAKVDFIKFHFLPLQAVCNTTSDVNRKKIIKKQTERWIAISYHLLPLCDRTHAVLLRTSSHSTTNSTKSEETI